jgi:Putative Ig domain/Kelch motif/Galactose oxidase, central domain
MNQARWSESVTTLPDGRVVVIGGTASISGVITTLSSIEIFDPAGNGGVGSWSSGGNLLTVRTGHTATLVGTKILVTGGWPASGSPLQSAELYDPSTFTSVATTSAMNAARANHTATLLSNGDVLLAGGYSNGSTTSAEVYNPGSGNFTSTAGQMAVFRGEHTATLLTTGPDSGKVMIIGGSGFFPNPAATSEVYDPATSTFANRPSLKTPRLRHTTTTLADGRLLIIGGGIDSMFYNPAISEVEIYNPLTQTFATLGDLLVDRQNHTANLLTAGPDQGNVFVAGGRGFSDLGARSAEIVPPTPPEGPMITPVAMPDGNIGVLYPSTTLTASGGSGSGYSFQFVWGQLPPGLSLTGGVIQGTPTASGEYWFIVRVTDSNSFTGYRSFTIRIDRPAITSSPQLPNATINTAYNHQLTANGTSPIAWFVDKFSSLPTGLSLSSGGLLSGTPTVSGDYNFLVHAKDASGQEVTVWFGLHINP